MKPADDGYRMLAAQCLRKQSRRLARQVRRIGADDQFEIIHQARVASRRLSTALRSFADALPRKKARRWRQDVSRAAKRLGAARDKDVQIEYLEQVLLETHGRALRPGIRRLLVRLRQGRDNLDPGVVKAAWKLRKSRTLKAVSRQAKEMLASLAPQGATIQTPPVLVAARQRILKRLAETNAYEPCLADANQIEQHHEMRIATKHLRYTMELFSPAYEGTLDAPLSAARKLQQLLGDLHDCDIWLEMLSHFIQAERDRTEAYFGKADPVRRLEPGIEHLLARRRADRERIFEALGRKWQALSAEGCWDALTATLDDALARAEAAAEEEAARAAEAAARADEEARRAAAEADLAAPALQAAAEEYAAQVALIAAEVAAEIAEEIAEEAEQEKAEPAPAPASPRRARPDIAASAAPASQEAPIGSHAVEQTPSSALSDSPIPPAMG